MEHEINLRQYHDDEGYFIKDYKIPFSICDKNHRITLANLYKITSDTAVEDFAQKGYSWAMLNENKVAILVSRTSFKIHKWPVADQCVTAKTWEEKPAGVQLDRRHFITDSQTGELLVESCSYWMAVNIETRRIIPAKLFTLRPQPEISTPFAGTVPGKIQIPENLTHAETRKVHYSDADGNGHVNNTRYGEYVMDVLPPELQDKPIKEIRMNYAKETLVGNNLDIYINSENQQAVTIVGKDNGEICFETVISFYL